MCRLHPLCLAVSLVTLLLPQEPALTQDWPQWRGANRDAKVTGFRAPASWPAELAQVWKVEVGEGVATPAVVGEKIYVFSRQDGREVIRCLEAATGKELWKDDYDSLGATGPASGFSGPRCSPSVADGKVVTLGVRGILSCLDVVTGKVIWRKDDFSGSWPRFFTSSSPLAAEGLCVAQLGGGDQGGIVAYRLDTGDEAWRWMGDGPAYASPVLADIDGTPLVVTQTDQKMVALRLADGEPVWETRFAVQGRGYNAATPIVDGNLIIYAGSGRGATAVRLQRKDDAFVAQKLWDNPDNSVQFNSPVLSDGRVYGLSADDQLFCLNAADGTTLWAGPLSSTADAAATPERGGGGRGRRGGGGRGGFGSIVSAGSVLFALTPAAQLVAFAPSATAFTELARYRVSDSPTHAYPVVVGQRLFVKDEGSLALWQMP